MITRKGQRGRGSGDDRFVVGAGDRYREREEGRLIVRWKVVLDLHPVGQRQRLAGGEEVEIFVGEAIGEGRRTVIVVAGVRCRDELCFDRRDVRKLVLVQRCDVAMSVLVDKRIERCRSCRNIAAVGVDPVNPDGDAVVVQAIAGRVGDFGNREDAVNVAAGVEDNGGRRTGDARIGVRWPVRSWSRTTVGRLHGEKNREHGRSIRQFEAPELLRRDRIGKMLEGFGVRVVRELQREHIGDKLLQIGRQRGTGDADLTLADVDLLSGLIDRRDRRKRGFVEQNVGTGVAVRLDQDLECRGRYRLGPVCRNRELAVKRDCSSADAHGRNRRINLHVAVFCGLAGDESDGARYEAEQR